LTLVEEGAGVGDGAGEEGSGNTPGVDTGPGATTGTVVSDGVGLLPAVTETLSAETSGMPMQPAENNIIIDTAISTICFIIYAPGMKNLPDK